MTLTKSDLKEIIKEIINEELDLQKIKELEEMDNKLKELGL